MPPTVGTLGSTAAAVASSSSVGLGLFLDNGDGQSKAKLAALHAQVVRSSGDCSFRKHLA